MAKIEKIKNQADESIFPVTVADAVLMGDGKTLKGELSELGSKLGFIRISDKQYNSLTEVLSSVKSEYRKAFASLYYKDEKGLFHFYYFLSANPSDTNWMNTSLWLPIYTGYDVDKLIVEAKEHILSKVNSTKGFIRVSDKQYENLSEVLAEIPDELRTAYASLYYKGNDGLFHFYYFISISPTETNWNNTSLWLPIYTGVEVDSIIGSRINNINNIISFIQKYNGLIKLSDKQYADLSEALADVPIDLRKAYSSIYFKDDKGIFNFYYFISANPTETNWNNKEYWQRIYTAYDVDILLSNLKTESLPKTIVEFYPNLSGGYGRFLVYMRQGDSNIYLMLDLSHVVDDSDIVYLDIWRLNGSGGVYRYNGTTMENLNINLLLGVENEFTLRFADKSDYTGGYHGDERIDTVGSFVKFYIDGKELSTDEMSVAFKRECETFCMLSSATLHDTSVDGVNSINGHPIVGKHVKKTTIDNCGYHCENRVDFDFSATGESQREISDWFSGLVCVSKDCGQRCYAQNYVIHDTSSGDNSQILVENAIGGKAVFMGEKVSCSVDSKVITEDDKNCSITFWNRPTDTKYYRRPPLRTVKTGDVFMTEVDVRWIYSDNVR